MTNLLDSFEHKMDREKNDEQGPNFPYFKSFDDLLQYGCTTITLALFKVLNTLKPTTE